MKRALKFAIVGGSAAGLFAALMRHGPATRSSCSSRIGRSRLPTRSLLRCPPSARPRLKSSSPISSWLGAGSFLWNTYPTCIACCSRQVGTRIREIANPTDRVDERRQKEVFAFPSSWRLRAAASSTYLGKDSFRYELAPSVNVPTVNLTPNTALSMDSM